MNQGAIMRPFHSRNDRAPNDYKRKFTISAHALERFRERVDEEFRSRPDLDLGNLLDERLRHAERQYTVRDPRAPEEITYLYAIATRRGDSFYVVVRNETAVTVLDPDMAQKNFQGTWTSTMNTPFTADSLRDVAKAIQSAPKIKLTPRDQAVLRGDLPPLPSTPEVALPAHGAAPEFTPLELAGLRHARALKNYRECELAVERAKRAVFDAETALQLAHDERVAALEELTMLAQGPSDE
jgi:hypothetical protein